MTGQIVGNYKIEQKLGEGGMGAVFRGVDMMLEREVAIKFLRPELSAQPQVVERFRSEAVTLAKLNHPNIATLFNFMRQGESFFMVLEFVRGSTLDNVIQQRGALPSEQAIPLFCQVLDGIQHAHDFGIIHRDIKPANMMLTEKGNLKVLDFGIARILGTARMTRQGNIIGTIEYMSPEQVRGFETDARSDIYSLGMLLYEMLTGRCPFDMQNEFELMKAQIEQYPVPPRQLNPAIPEVVEQAIWKAIQKDPAQRFQSASEFRSFLLNAGFAATGRLEPLAVGDPNPYATRPLNTQSPLSNPPAGGFATMPSQPGYATPSQPGYPTPPSQPGVPTPSQPGVPSQPGLAPPSHPGVSTPSHPGYPTPSASNPGMGNMDATLVNAPIPASDSAAKETRIGAPGAFAAAAGGHDLKATRIGAAPMSPQPQGFAQPAGFAPPPRAQQQQSFFSKLTWVHFAGAGAVLLLVVGIVVGIAAFALTRGNKVEPLKPKALTEESKPAPPSTNPEQPAAPAQPGDTAKGNANASSTGDAAGSNGTLTQPKPTEIVPVAPVETSSSGETSRQAASHPAAPRQTAPAPAPPKPRNDASADAAKRRKAAINALDQ
ncbi:MAG TPA: protein kinase [Pyrinomonadaceae bacterium]|jgi:serine/threonine-protein kinase|nr:protein kinase [Pyrinomonadaceae bacterium]